MPVTVVTDPIGDNVANVGERVSWKNSNLFIYFRSRRTDNVGNSKRKQEKIFERILSVLIKTTTSSLFRV